MFGEGGREEREQKAESRKFSSLMLGDERKGGKRKASSAKADAKSQYALGVLRRLAPSEKRDKSKALSRPLFVDRAMQDYNYGEPQRAAAPSLYVCNCNKRVDGSLMNYGTCSYLLTPITHTYTHTHTDSEI